MAKVIGVKFKSSPKIYYFEAGKHTYTENCGVIVETARGVEFGTVALLPHEVSNDKIVPPLKPIIRVATQSDYKTKEELEGRRDSTIAIVEQKIRESGLEMKLVDVEYTFDAAKLIVYFLAEGRVDFRELVKELAAVFKLRIELRQIGARDECKMLGGLGPCGRACCCSDHISKFAHVTIKMAKNQNLSLNPGKISGLCGRLMCCLEYENPYYVEVNKKMPKLGSEVVLNDGKSGKVTDINQIKETVSLRVDTKDRDGFEIITVPLSQIVSKCASAAEDFAADNDITELKDLED